MKELAYLNPFLWKYRGRVLMGFLFIVLTNIFNVYAPQLIGDGIDFVYQIVSTQSQWNQQAIAIPLPSSIQLIDGFTHWGTHITLSPQNASQWAVTIGMILSIGYLVVFIIKGIFLFYQRQSIIVMSRHIEFDLKNVIYHQYQALDSEFYRRNRTGDLMNRISEDVTRVRMYLGPAVMYTINLVVLIVLCAVVMWNINGKLTLFTLGPLPIMMFGIFYVSTVINRRTEKVQRQQSKLSTIVQEAFSGIRVIKTFRRESYLADDFKKESDAYKKHQMELVKADALFMPVISILVGLSTILTIYIGSLEVNAGNITIGTIVQFVFYVNQLTWPFASVGWVTSLVRKAEASQARINEFLRTTPSIPTDSGLIIDIQGDIRFKEVDFVYQDTQIHALKKISFHLPVGKSLGIIGRTGSGKSTLAQLLTRTFDPTSGVIEMDGQPITAINVKHFRKNIGYVPQDVFLFSDTIAQNIGFGLENPSPQAIEDAAKDAAIWEDIQGFPNKMDTLLGERGINLSGGQKQRVSIARAIIKNPPVLLFDDCLSAVDNSTEEKILKGLNARMANRTAILIAHRVSTVMHCDYIMVLDDGKIMEWGQHDQLIQQNGIYQQLFSLQNEQAE
jgi:ATP-binding cassette subfamily B protein